MRKINRRNFLKVTGVLAAASALAACGGSSTSTAGSTGSTAGSAASADGAKAYNELTVGTDNTDLKADLKKKITGERRESAQRAFEDVLMQKVAEGITCDIPDAMVNLQAEQMANNFKQQLASQGIPFDQYLKMTNTTEADFTKQAYGPAEQQVKMDLAVKAIIDAEKLDATDDEVEAEMKNVADKYGMDLDTVKKYLRPEEVKEQVIREKVIKVVADSAKAVAPAEEKAELEAEGEIVEKPAKKPAAKKTTKKAEGEEKAEKAPAKKPAAKKTAKKDAE